MSISNKDYLDELIAKAKKSWAGVDVDSYIKNLRDMDKERIRCRDLMCGDWITDEHGFPMQITTVGEDYAYATFDGNEGDPWEYDDKDDQPQPIPLTPEIMEKNGWYYGLTSDEEDAEYCLGGCHYDQHWCYDEGAGAISLIFPNDEDAGQLIVDDQCFNRHLEFIFCDTLQVHELQRPLRLCGLNQLADNFKV